MRKVRVTDLVCDYLVIGSGAASLAFVDTMLTEVPTANIIMVDKKPSPGGHWVDAYDFVQLHQPSLLYGVASSQLEGNWLKCMLTTLDLPWKHRASKHEILSYYQRFIDEKVASGKLKYYPSCNYDFEQEAVDDTYHFSSLHENEVYSVKVKGKVVNGVLGECKVPSQYPVEFPVDKGINLLTPNDLYNKHKAGNLNNMGRTKFVVLGCGKTGMDSIVFLQRKMKIKPENIEWVIPNDVWMLAREGPGGPWSWPDALLRNDGDQEKACFYLEEKGVFVRMDQQIKPTRFRFPVIGKDELKYMRKVNSLIRKGRVTSLSIDEKKVIAKFGPDQEPWVSTSGADECVFIHCTSPGPFNGKKIDELFASEKTLNLSMLFAPPVPISMSCLAYIEAARSKGDLDLQFGRELLQVSRRTLPNGSDVKATENEVLASLFPVMELQADKKNFSEHFQPLLNLALLLALGNRNPLVVHEWMKNNRLSFLSIPGFKCGIYENLNEIITKGKDFGYSEDEIEFHRLLANKLEPLKSK